MSIGESVGSISEAMIRPGSIRRKLQADPIRRILTSIGSVIIAFVPRMMNAGNSMTTDEFLWRRRSFRFSEALLGLELDQTSSSLGELATMPGVTTMWVGTGARLLHRLGKSVGMIDADARFVSSDAGLFLSQLAMAFVTAVLVGFIVWSAWGWIGSVAAVTAGVFLATEPLLVGHGAVLHTDELTALFGALMIIAFARTYGYGGTRPERAGRWAALFGIFGALLFLTKLAAGLYLPALGLLLLFALVHDVRRTVRAGRPWHDALSLRHTLLALIAGAVTVALLWPALAVDPITQFRALRQSASIAGAGHDMFFLGRTSPDPGPLFYGVTTPLRVTPWLLVAAVLFAPLAIVDHRLRRAGVVLTIFAVGIVVVLMVSARKADRYILPVLPLLAMLTGCGLSVVCTAVADRLSDSRRLVLSGLASVTVAAMTVHAAATAPWSLLYFNPIFGGPERVESTMLVGWSQGLDIALDRVLEREKGDCRKVRIRTTSSHLALGHPCGIAVNDDPDPDYVLRVLNAKQRGWGASDGVLVDEVRARGFVLVEIFETQPRPER